MREIASCSTPHLSIIRDLYKQIDDLTDDFSYHLSHLAEASHDCLMKIRFSSEMYSRASNIKTA